MSVKEEKTYLPKIWAPRPLQGKRACEHRCGGGSSLFWAEMITHKLASIQCVHNVIILQQNVLINSFWLQKDIHIQLSAQVVS